MHTHIHQGRQSFESKLLPNFLDLRNALLLVRFGHLLSHSLGANEHPLTPIYHESISLLSNFAPQILYTPRWSLHLL